MVRHGEDSLLVFLHGSLGWPFIVGWDSDLGQFAKVTSDLGRLLIDNDSLASSLEALCNNLTGTI